MKNEEAISIVENLSESENGALEKLARAGLKGLDYPTKAKIIKNLLDHGHPKEKLITKFLPLFGFQPSLAILEGIIKLNNLPEQWKDYLVKREINLKTILELVHFSDDLLEHVFPLISRLDVGGHKLIRIIEIISEISQRERLSPINLIKEDVISKIVQDDNLSKPEKTSRITECLIERRMPYITELKKIYETRLKKMDLPHQLKIIPPENFEGRNWEIRLRFENKSTLERLSREVQKLTRPENYDEIFNIS